ncbi:HIT-domain-containing protein [Terfezia boudieri ATCC MYA-4762]|uniref:Bis(5'-adenosyl)-triphosphatase n=1 Tax=Terfezia boudieri ATCC MYA-4762 TaxID=1051890 RepID=A0A3N4M643_9PEZI|nr:HIT-domain-containing protein [Terfezia boudieri ATCC MYA-4762]
MAATGPAYFGSFIVTSQVFYKTPLSFAIVNVKPLLPGHVLVCSNRVVPRLKDLSTAEVTDLFLTAQKVSKVVETVYGAQGLNIAIQDGIAAGQSVPHVHTHLIPRRFKDLANSDDIYALIESEAGDLDKLFRERDNSQLRPTEPSTPVKVAVEVNKEMVLSGETQSAVSIAEAESQVPGRGRAKFPTPLPDELRKPRTLDEMEKEAKILAKFMAEYDRNSKL